MSCRRCCPLLKLVFEVFMVLTMKITVSLDVTPYSLMSIPKATRRYIAEDNGLNY
jgi:hypothetical protein